jgi:hypothetical protein
MATASGRNDMIGVTWRLIRDLYTVVADGVWWLWTRLWRLNRGLARTLLPGQSRAVHSLVALCAVLLEIVGLWVAAVDFAARH